MVLNFGAQPWKFPPLDGFAGFASANEKQVCSDFQRINLSLGVSIGLDAQKVLVSTVEKISTVFKS
jgi:hypothetical protein